MGGRSRIEREKFRTRWTFIEELSNERLDNYGKYTNVYITSTAGTKLPGDADNKTDFHIRLAEEYVKRNGVNPEWYLANNMTGAEERKMGTSNYIGAKAYERRNTIPDSQRNRELHNELDRREGKYKKK